MQCFHECRGTATAKRHVWCHEVKGSELLDPYQLFCDSCGAEVATQILSRLNRDSKSEARSQGWTGDTSETPWTPEADSGASRYALSAEDSEEMVAVRATYSLGCQQADDFTELQIL
jgi:hypothetical protein